MPLDRAKGDVELLREVTHEALGMQPAHYRMYEVEFDPEPPEG